MTDKTMAPKSRVTLRDCPIGLFMCDGELCLKTEYGNSEGHIDAYIVSSGEFFWGDQPQTIKSQNAQLVQPISDETVEGWLTANGQADTWRDAVSEVLEELADLMDDVVSENYTPDSFTTQPARDLLRALKTLPPAPGATT